MVCVGLFRQKRNLFIEGASLYHRKRINLDELLFGHEFRKPSIKGEKCVFAGVDFTTNEILYKKTPEFILNTKLNPEWKTFEVAEPGTSFVLKDGITRSFFRERGYIKCGRFRGIAGITLDELSILKNDKNKLAAKIAQEIEAFVSLLGKLNVDQRYLKMLLARFPKYAQELNHLLEKKLIRLQDLKDVIHWNFGPTEVITLIRTNRLEWAAQLLRKDSENAADNLRQMLHKNYSK